MYIFKAVRGEGVYLFDENGKKYLDAAAGTFNLSLGYSHPALIAAAKEQLEILAYASSSFSTDAVAALSEKLLSVSPISSGFVHLKVTGGSTANEVAIRMALKYTGKPGIISLARSHLGQTLFMHEVSDFPFKKVLSYRYPGIIRVPSAYCYRCPLGLRFPSCGIACANEIRKLVSSAKEKPACLIMEPILGNGGNIMPPVQYFKEMREICDELEIALIFDEVQTGIGRTGEMFAAQTFKVKPDIITVAKGLGGIGFNVAAVIAEKRFDCLEKYEKSFTSGASALPCAVATKIIDIIRQKPFLQNVKASGNLIRKRLNELQEKFNFIGDVRGVGLMLGVEFVNLKGGPDSKITNLIAAKALGNGLILRTSQYGLGNVIKIKPPLILTLEEANEVCDKFEKTLKQVNAHVPRGFIKTGGNSIP